MRYLSHFVRGNHLNTPSSTTTTAHKEGVRTKLVVTTITPSVTKDILTTLCKHALLGLIVFMFCSSILPHKEGRHIIESSTTELQTSVELADDDLEVFGDELDPHGDEGNEDTEIPYEAYIDIFVRNADLNQPLLQFKDTAMPEEKFLALQSCLREHPMRHSNVNDDNTFKGTRGFLLSFNQKGIDRFRNNPHFSCLYPYFKRHVLSNTNAWVLNMVWADVPDYSRELAIQRHTDDAIMLDFEGSKKVMPFQTNVLYVFVPEDMVGGDLEAWDYDITPEVLARGPQAKIKPIENRMAYFRGDAQHQVRSYNTSSKKVLRGSLVLEQYDVPEEYRELVLEFHWRDNDGTEMM